MAEYYLRRVRNSNVMRFWDLCLDKDEADRHSVEIPKDAEEYSAVDVVRCRDCPRYRVDFLAEDGSVMSSVFSD